MAPPARSAPSSSAASPRSAAEVPVAARRQRGVEAANRVERLAADEQVGGRGEPVALDQLVLLEVDGAVVALPHARTGAARGDDGAAGQVRALVERREP